MSAFLVLLTFLKILFVTTAIFGHLALNGHPRNYPACDTSHCVAMATINIAAAAVSRFSCSKKHQSLPHWTSSFKQCILWRLLTAISIRPEWRMAWNDCLTDDAATKNLSPPSLSTTFFHPLSPQHRFRLLFLIEKARQLCMARSLVMQYIGRSLAMHVPHDVCVLRIIIYRGPVCFLLNKTCRRVVSEPLVHFEIFN